MNLQTRTKRIVIIGATSSIAEQCARLWVAQAPVDLVLVGRDMPKLEMLAADLRVRSPGSAVMSQFADFNHPAHIQGLADQLFAEGAVDIVLIAHGSLPVQADCEGDLSNCQQALSLNGLSPVLFAEAFAGHMHKANSGTLALIGSVAGDRGRKSNYVYGAAKGMVTRYAQGLQHRLAATGVKVVLIKPGPTDTPMTAHLKRQGAKMAEASSVARDIVSGIERGKPVVYAPAKWAVIMMIIRHLPGAVFNRMDI